MDEIQVQNFPIIEDLGMCKIVLSNLMCILHMMFHTYVIFCVFLGGSCQLNYSFAKLITAAPHRELHKS